MRDLTKGPPIRCITLFAIPMILSGLFQQIYNVADTVIVGRYLGVDALAAVSNAGTITQLFVMICTGASMGVSVTVGQYFGMGDHRRLKGAVYTAMLSFAVFGLAFAALCVLLTPWLIDLVNTPAQIRAEAIEYLRIFVFGLPFLYLYNVCNQAFNGMGDSKKSLYFLIFSSVLNVVLDLLFVAQLHWGVAGAAWATLISQALACLLSAGTLLARLRRDLPERAARVFDAQALGTIVRIGIPTTLQLISVSLGNMVVQAIVNPYGTDVMAGYAAAGKINNLAWMAITNLGGALSTFTAQNIGAEKFERPGQGMRGVLIFDIVYSLVIMVVLLAFSAPLVRLFCGDGATAAMLDTGRLYFYFVAPAYLLYSVMNAFNGVTRGAGYMRGFTFSTMSDIVVRCLLSWLLNALVGLWGVFFAIGLGWAVGMTIAVVVYRGGKWKRSLVRRA